MDKKKEGLVRMTSLILISILFFCFTQSVAAEQSMDNERFQIVDESVVLDSQTGLMWASRDNGKDIDYYEAATYCKEFKGGGYSDWRIPTIEELATLYAQKNKAGYFVTDLITVSGCCIWSEYELMGGAPSFSFRKGKEAFAFMQDKSQLRALPVRRAAKMEPRK